MVEYGISCRLRDRKRCDRTDDGADDAATHAGRRVIGLDRVTKIYHPRGGHRNIVLNDVSATFPTGRNIGVLGLNGAGKSTLIRLISGTELPDHGKVHRDRHVSFPLGLATIFHPDLSGRENIRFLADIYGVDARFLTNFVQDFSELGWQFDNQTKTYSSGMLAKLAFGTCLGIDFDIYLIDEITEVGDGRFREKALAAFAERTAYSDIILVSHNVDTIRQFTNMGAVLHKGQLEMFDDVEAAIVRYRSLA